MTVENIIDLLLRLRNATLNRSIKLHNFFLRFRFAYLLCLVIIWFFLHDLAIALSILIFSFIIYIGPKATRRLIENLNRKMENSEKLSLQYEALWVEVSTAESREKHELALNKITEMQNNDDDLKVGIRILIVLRWLLFILMTSIIVFAVYGIYKMIF